MSHFTIELYYSMYYETGHKYRELNYDDENDDDYASLCNSIVYDTFRKHNIVVTELNIKELVGDLKLLNDSIFTILNRVEKFASSENTITRIKRILNYDTIELNKNNTLVDIIQMCSKKN